LGLWRIVGEYQLNSLVPHLPVNLQKRLPCINFKELILSGHEVCAGLLEGVIAFYLADDATVDAISAKLHNTCPTLFRSEDAAAAKAKQLLQQAQQVRHTQEFLIIII
jgi:nuclear pore complex protein Nup155